MCWRVQLHYRVHIILFKLYEFNKIKLTKKIQRIDKRLNPHCVLISATLTITLECFQSLCEAVIESYLCLGEFVQLVKFI